VRNVEISTSPVPAAATTSPTTEFGPEALDGIPDRAIDDWGVQVAAEAAGQDAEDLGELPDAGGATTGTCSAPAVVAPGPLTGAFRGRTKAPHARQKPTSGGYDAPHCQQVIVRILSQGTPRSPANCPAQAHHDVQAVRIRPALVRFSPGLLSARPRGSLILSRGV
jgi:hypothetical protein